MISIHATRRDGGELLEIICTNLFDGLPLILSILDNSEEILQYKVGMPSSGYVDREYFGLIGDRAKKWVTKFDGEDDE